jgi:probable rRNA maturation factor
MTTKLRNEPRNDRRRDKALMLTLQNALPDTKAAAGHRVPVLRTLRRWAGAALSPQARGAIVTVRIVGTAEGRRLNRDWRSRDYATNVLSFGYSLPDGKSGSLHGDLVLCAPVVEKEARDQDKTVTAHYAHMVVHGLLHLQGYDHEDDAEAGRMERRERHILKRLGYADPYAAEAASAAAPRSAFKTTKRTHKKNHG